MLDHHPLAAKAFPGALAALTTNKLFESRDLEETRAMVGRVMKPHHLGIVGRGQRLESRMHHVSLGEVSLSRLHYGADVDIEPGPLGDFFLVQMPLKGWAHVECGEQVVESGPEMASVLNASENTAMRWRADNDQIMVRISRALVERTLAVQLGRHLHEPIQFRLGFRWRDSELWTHLITYLLECASQVQCLHRHRLVVAHIEQLVAATLLGVHSHNYENAAPVRGGPVLPRHVRKVQEYLDAHAHEPIRAEQMAQVAGVSLRSLYAGFREFCGVSPMQYLRDLRLERARADLLGGGGSVSGVALRWGFGHLGRFSAEYRERFGESPKESLRHH
ncbi:AraC family transcriptional regulator [Cupriavidus campinensis]|uniref:AraC family transcriptional regulator n=1 Tax=Cupriavidus campinensis TaxID=151783 RepID=UPI0024E206AE|nr:AraC family transcriptional regulator [Cupriavidus campinensis]